MKFTIGFEKKDQGRLFNYFEQIIQSQSWSEGKFTQMFEDKWGAYHNAEAIAFSSWAGAALSALEFFDVKGKTVLCPANTFIATPLSIIKAGAAVEFVDCNKDDLCMNVEDLRSKIDKYNPVAVFVVHIGGHIAFHIEEISRLCRDRGIVLLEDCAHAHGADWNGRKPGNWGAAGIYSFYATKTISTGEGGMLITRAKDLVNYARKYRNYGKFEYDVEGLNYRMSEFTAAIGCIQTERLDEIIDWKNEYARKHLDPQYPNRVKFPAGMKSGYYKYIVFDSIENSTGRVYDAPCHLILGKAYSLPNTEWVARNYWCAPIYYKGEGI